MKWYACTSKACEKSYVPSESENIARVYRQWSWPINLPLPLLGIFGARPLRPDDPDAPWAGDVDVRVLSHPIGIAPYTEAVMFHRPTKTLLVIDAVVYVADDPPEVNDNHHVAGKDMYKNSLNAKPSPVGSPEHVHWTAAAASRK